MTRRFLSLALSFRIRIKLVLTALALLFFFASLPAAAATVVESFTSRAHLDSDGGMVWNIGLGELHPPLQIEGWEDGGGVPQTTTYEVGDGRHGAFVSSRYAAFDVNGVVSGGVIEIDTEAYPNLQFTSFHLESGYVLRSVGSRPLVIRSQTDFIVGGEIDCSGDDGASGVASPSTSRAGGDGRCGGGAGGASVPAGAAPSSSHRGVSGGTGVGGGLGGPQCLASGGQGGGGGGAFIKAYAVVTDKPDPEDGDDSLGGTGGLAGDLEQDDGFVTDIDGAGSGGGGGSAYDDAAFPALHSSGSGGGGGGGNIRVYVVGDVVIQATGEIHADGGDGGAVGGGALGGAGGGGGGGSILIFAGGTITITSAGSVTAAAGSGGATAGGDGGDGAWGRTWIVETGGFASGGAGVEDPQTNLAVPGNARFETGVTYTVTSSAIDIGSTRPTLSALPISVVALGASTLTYELAFSESSSLANLSGFALSSTYVGDEVQRFGRFRIQVNNLDGQTPVRVQDLTFDYVGFEQGEFDFVTGCGLVRALGVGGRARESGGYRGDGRGPHRHGPSGLWLALFGLLLALPLVAWQRLRYFSSKI